jgi:cobalt/nickel transport system permease protein
MPEWLMKNENYIPQADKDTFVNKSILSVFMVISRIKMQDFKDQNRVKINVPLNIFCTFILLVLLSLTRSFIFVIIVNIYLLAILSAADSERMVRILKMSFGITLFTAIIMLPAFFLGNSYSSIMITSKVFATVTAMGLISQTTKWNTITGALKKFYIPDMFILILDITIKYIYMLGELSLNLFYALKLRSVGKNNGKYASMAGVAGTVFLQSKEMAEDMYHAMECRGFTGEYHTYNKSKLRWIDYLYIIVNIGFVILFIYFGRI